MIEEAAGLARFFAMLTLVWTGGGVACDSPSAPKPAYTVEVPIGTEAFRLEIADTEWERAKGLMYRESMPANHGMIFLFAEESDQGFWMKNTFIPLDILYLDKDGRVVSVKQMKPRDLTPVPSDGKAMYAIELNAGAAARAGVKAGDVVALPKEIREGPRE